MIVETDDNGSGNVEVWSTDSHEEEDVCEPMHEPYFVAIKAEDAECCNCFIVNSVSWGS